MPRSMNACAFEKIIERNIMSGPDYFKLRTQFNDFPLRFREETGARGHSRFHVRFRSRRLAPS
jgi:hypothetical protein